VLNVIYWRVTSLSSGIGEVRPERIRSRLISPVVVTLKTAAQLIALAFVVIDHQVLKKDFLKLEVRTQLIVFMMVTLLEAPVRT
jgi:hypothetical protein